MSDTATGSRQAFIGVGANLGDRQAALLAARDALRRTPGISAVDMSSLYETEPVGVTDQPRFLNAVIGVATTLTPEELLAALLAIERAHGRERRERWGPRTLDLDLLGYEGEKRATAALTLPHPRLWERAFVTVPLRELLSRPAYDGAHWAAWRKKLGTGQPVAEVRKIGTF